MADENKSLQTKILILINTLLKMDALKRSKWKYIGLFKSNMMFDN